MTNRSTEQLLFPGCKGRRVEAEFSGGNVTSDAGVLLVRQADLLLGLTTSIARLLEDPRRQGSCEHTVLSMLRQRVYGLAAGYEDLNDHDALRWDLAWQTAVERDKPAASSATLCRLENRAGRESAVAMHQVLVNQFIASHPEPPTELILDCDATDDPVHGNQEGRFFHGYLRPLLLFAALRHVPRSAAGGLFASEQHRRGKHAWAILALLVKRLRQQWPEVRIIFRGDSGFCRWRMLAWCDRHAVGYLVGLAKNERINKLAAPLIDRARKCFDATGRKQRLFGNPRYGAHTWDRPRRVIARIEHTSQGSNPRYVVTNLPGNSRKLYERIYCARGEMENRIKEQMQLFSDRTSAHRWWPNQFRLLLSALAYTLAGGHAPPGSQGNRVGACASRHHPAQAAQDRRGDRPQYPPGALLALKRLSLSAPVLARGHPVETRIRPQGALPGTGKKMGVRGRCARDPEIAPFHQSKTKNSALEPEKCLKDGILNPW